MFSDYSCESWIVISLLMTDWSLFGPLPLLFVLESNIFSHADQVFDEMLERVFILILGQLTYAEMWGWLFSMGRVNNRDLDMKIVSVAG